MAVATRNGRSKAPAVKASNLSPFAVDLGAKVIAQTDEAVTYVVKLPAPSFMKLRLHLTGDTPLISDAFSEPRKARFAKTQDGSAKVKPGPRDPEAEMQEAIYRRPDGGYGFPKLAFLKAFATAATRMTSVKGTEALAAVQIDTADEFLALDCSEPVLRRDHVTRQGRGNLVYRPLFATWAVWVPIQLDPEVVSLDQLIHIVRKAGAGVGVGNWRPEKKGDFGRWNVDDISEVTVTKGVALDQKN